MADGIARVLVDAAGNLFKSVQDGSDYLLGVASKLRNVAGTIINPATEETLGSVETHLQSVLDPNNSTTDQLADYGSFVGTGTDVLGYSAIAVTVHSDKDSAEDGMRFEFSQDNVNWDDVYDWNMNTSESTTRRFQFPVTSRYFRVNYQTRLATAFFRVQTILHRQNILTSIHRLDKDASPDRSAQVVKSAIIAQRIGTRREEFTPVGADLLGNLKVVLGAESLNTQILAEARDQLVKISAFLEAMGD